MKKGVIVLFSFIFIILLINFVSASWFSDLWNKLFNKPVQLAPGEICWNGNNRNIHGDSSSQVDKFCYCAMGTYGHNSKDKISGDANAYQYTDASANTNWAVTLLTNYKSPVYRVKCKDSNFYLTDRTYYQGGTCIPLLVNTTLTNWVNLNCVSGQRNQSRYKTEYDSRNCGTFTNRTYYEYRLIADSSCITCTPEANNTFCTRLNKTCGSFTGNDNCGVSRTVNCGTCTTGTCTNNICVVTCTPEANNTFCTRLNKTCGSVTSLDNCGVSRTVNCGNCSSGYGCNTTLGTCFSIAGCVANNTACTGRTCGSVANGTCGDISCGSCSSGNTCNSTRGTCYVTPCIPNNTVCSGRVCGSFANGTCGNISCGTCPTGKICQSGLCINSSSCVPDCNNKECGSNGCGGSCGSCDDYQTCSSGECIDTETPSECGDGTCDADEDKETCPEDCSSSKIWLIILIIIIFIIIVGIILFFLLYKKTWIKEKFVKKNIEPVNRVKIFHGNERLAR